VASTLPVVPEWCYNGYMTVNVNVRFPDELHARLKRSADEAHRSLNAQIIWLLDEATRQEDES